MKTCIRCKISKPLVDFYRNKRRADGRHPYCKPCFEIPRKTEQGKARNVRNQLDWRKKPRNLIYSKVKDVIYNSLKLTPHFSQTFGYTMDDLASHLEARFKEGMSWENYGKEWCIDHIVPQSRFEYSTIHDEEFRRCWALSNLQPLWNYENRLKGNREAEQDAAANP